ncbi:hypothetical protein ACVGVP_04270 [Pseudonocardia artemisiae]
MSGALDRAAAGRTGAVLLSGEAGVGTCWTPSADRHAGH